MLNLKTIICLLYVLMCLQFAYCEGENQIAEINAEAENNTTTLTYLEEPTTTDEVSENETQLRNLRGHRGYNYSGASTSQLYNSVNARSDAYNSYSPRYNPTTQYNQGGYSAQSSYERAGAMWQEIRSRDGSNTNAGAAPPANN